MLGCCQNFCACYSYHPNALPCCGLCAQSTAALPFGTIVIVTVIWGLVTIPLTVFGGIAGKNNR